MQAKAWLQHAHTHPHAHHIFPESLYQTSSYAFKVLIVKTVATAQTKEAQSRLLISSQLSTRESTHHATLPHPHIHSANLDIRPALEQDHI
jgi:hypothetical protein